MLLPDAARACILENTRTLHEITLPLQQSSGFVLAEDVVADRDQPPTNRSAMDGFAVRSDDLKQCPSSLHIRWKGEESKRGDGLLKHGTELDAVSLRISVTDRCQYRCIYCRPGGEQEETPQGEQFLSPNEIERFVRFLSSHFRLQKVHITGGEPLTRSDIVDIVSRLSALGVEDIALTTNGQLLGGMALSLKQAGLQRINISLDSLNAGAFERLTRGGRLSSPLDGIDEAIACGLSPVKINTVVLRNVNDTEIGNIAEYGLERKCQVRFLELMPIGVSTTQFRDWFVPSTEVRSRLEERFTLHSMPVKKGGSSRDYKACTAAGREGIIGFISPESSPFCSECSRLRLSASGRLSGCLACDERIDIRPYLTSVRDTSIAQLHAAVKKAMVTKRNGGCFTTRETMLTIGG